MRGLILSLAIALVCGRMAAGQWLNLPTPDVPRTSEGRPDFSGLWQPGRKIPCGPKSGGLITLDTELIDEMCLQNEKFWSRTQGR